MFGDNFNSYNLDKPAGISQHQAQGEPMFDVDLSFPRNQQLSRVENQWSQVAAQLQSQWSQPDLYATTIGQTGQSRGTSVSNEGPIGAMSMPSGWTEASPAAPPPGTFVFQTEKGRSFLPPDQNPSVSINIDSGIRPVTQQEAAYLNQVLLSKSAYGGPQPLSDQEVRALGDIIMPGANYNISSAYTANINGKTALVVRGNFPDAPDGTPGFARESVFIESGQPAGGTAAPRIEQLYLAAPKDQIGQYEQPFHQALNTIQWAQEIHM
jgi:hypothetical protein